MGEDLTLCSFFCQVRSLGNSEIGLEEECGVYFHIYHFGLDFGNPYLL